MLNIVFANLIGFSIEVLKNGSCLKGSSFFIFVIIYFVYILTEFKIYLIFHVFEMHLFKHDLIVVILVNILKFSDLWDAKISIVIIFDVESLHKFDQIV